jgi:hypothetical protein
MSKASKLLKKLSENSFKYNIDPEKHYVGFHEYGRYELHSGPHDSEDIAYQRARKLEDDADKRYPNDRNSHRYEVHKGSVLLSMHKELVKAPGSRDPY